MDDQPPGELFLCAPVLAELFSGLEQLPSGARRNRLAEWIRNLETSEFVDRILPFDRSATHEFGRIVAIRERAGRTIRVMDAIIGAIASAHGATVATRDVDDFADIGLDVVNPFEAR